VFFGGGGAAVKQLGIEVLGIAAAVAVVFVLSNVTVRILAGVMKGITTDFLDAEPVDSASALPAPLG
jgi:hypothetical protein